MTAALEDIYPEDLYIEACGWGYSARVVVKCTVRLSSKGRREVSATLAMVADLVMAAVPWHVGAIAVSVIGGSRRWGRELGAFAREEPACFVPRSTGIRQMREDLAVRVQMSKRSRRRSASDVARERETLAALARLADALRTTERAA